MKLKLSIFTVLFTFLMTNQIYSQITAKELGEIWEKNRISAVPPASVKHIHLKSYLESLKKLGVKVEEIGRSFEDREIYQMEFGTGKMKVFMWSKMHGNEPTATTTLIDMFAFLQKNRDKDWVKKMSETMTIRAVPMLNPDGAEIYTRRNAQQIDINRDALALQTPEGRLLKSLRDQWKPDIGFNLHNQNPWLSVGDTKKQATISLLAVVGNPNGSTSEGHIRNKRLCSLMITALNEYIEGHIGRYDEDYNPLAFGDLFSAGGTPTILVETGGMEGKDQMFFVKLNFVAYLIALNALVDGSEKDADPAIYENIPLNSSGKLFNIIFRDANILHLAKTETENIEDVSGDKKPAEFAAPFTADVGINIERRRTGEPETSFIREIGDLSIYGGFQEFDVKNYYLIPKTGEIQLGSRSELLFYKKSRKINWKNPQIIEKHKPDAVFAKGKWTKPLK